MADRHVSKTELADALSKRIPGSDERRCATAAQIIRNSLIEALAEGKRIEIHGFGTFARKFRDARWGRNPQTGEVVRVTPRYTVCFKAGKGLRRTVNLRRDVKD